VNPGEVGGQGMPQGGGSNYASASGAPGIEQSGAPLGNQYNSSGMVPGGDAASQNYIQGNNQYMYNSGMPGAPDSQSMNNQSSGYPTPDQYFQQQAGNNNYNSAYPDQNQSGASGTYVSGTASPDGSAGSYNGGGYAPNSGYPTNDVGYPNSGASGYPSDPGSYPAAGSNAYPTEQSIYSNSDSGAPMPSSDQSPYGGGFSSPEAYQQNPQQWTGAESNPWSAAAPQPAPQQAPENSSSNPAGGAEQFSALFGAVPSNQQTEHQTQAPEQNNSDANAGYNTNPSAAGQPQTGSGNPWTGFATSLSSSPLVNRPAQDKPAPPKPEAQQAPAAGKPPEQRKESSALSNFIKKVERVKPSKPVMPESLPPPSKPEE